MEVWVFAHASFISLQSNEVERMTVIEQETNSSLMARTASHQPGRSWRTWLIGRPLATADAPHQAIGKFVGLAVFSSDAMSSVAYGPQEMMLVLAAAGAAGLGYAVPLAIAIVVLLTILTLSYEQTIHAYPGGGGAYIVARDNLGELPAQTAGAALLTDYILTVAVSISSGVAQITSAFPNLYVYRVEIAVALVLFIMVVNLRGVKESGAVFAAPTYLFLGLAFLTVVVGMARFLTGNLGVVVNPPALELTHGAQALTLFLLLRAFASGTTSLTGVEAISNGITAFREPKSRNAGITLIWMSFILGSLLLGITFLAHQIGAVPTDSGETVISQVARTAYRERGPDLPGHDCVHDPHPDHGGEYVVRRLSPFGSAARGRWLPAQAIDVQRQPPGFLPWHYGAGSHLISPDYPVQGQRQRLNPAVCDWRVPLVHPVADRHGPPLVACGPLADRQGDRKNPGSTLRYEHGWQTKLAINAVGAVCTFIVMIVFAVTKFRDGAWIIVLLVPTLVFIFFRIHHHYKHLAAQLSLDDFGAPPVIQRQCVILPVGGVHRGTLTALAYAQSLSVDVTAVYVSIDPVEAEKVKRKWDAWGEGVRLVVLDSPYRLLIEPLLDYIQTIDANRQPGEIITVIVPQFVPKHRWSNLLHAQTAFMLRMALMFKRGIVITEVPYQID